MRLFSLSTSFLLATALLCGQAQSRRAPGFCLPDSRNNWHDLADYRGKVVLLDLMSTTCAHCGPFSKILEQVKTRYAGKVVVLSVAPTPDTPTTVARFAAQNKLTFPILFDSGQAAYSYVRTPAMELPHIYIIGPDGMIARDVVFGPNTTDIFQGNGIYAELDKVLGAKK